MYNEKTNTKEYRGAFYDWVRRNIKGEYRWFLGESDAANVTQTRDIAIPKTLDDKIWDTIHTNHPVWDDLNLQHVPDSMEITRQVGRKNKHGDYYNPNEIYEKINLTGVDIRKTVRLSYAAAEMSDGALEQYLESELASDIADAATQYLVNRILDCSVWHNEHKTMYDQYDIPYKYYDVASYEYDCPRRNCWNTGVKTSEGYFAGKPQNKTEYGNTLTYNWLCKMIGSCNGSNVKLYTDRYHGYGNLYGMVDTAGQPVFRKNKIAGFQVVMDDGFRSPVMPAGVKWGKHTRDDDFIDYGTGVLMALDPSDVIVNIIRPLTFEITKKSADGIIEITASMRLDATMRHRTSFSYWAFTNPTDAPPVERAALTVALAAPVATDVEDGDYDNYAVVDGLYTGDTAENADAWISTESTGTTPEYDYANTDTGYFKPGDTVDVTVETDSDFFDGTKTAVLSADGAIAPEDGEEITGNGNTYTVTIPNRENNTLMVHLNRTADGTSATPGDYEIMAVDVDDDGTELPPERKRIVIRRKHQEGTPEKPAPKRSRRKRG